MMTTTLRSHQVSGERLETRPDRSIAVITKAGALLDALAEGELTVPDIATRLGEPRSSVYRLLASLHEIGLVDPGARRGSHRLGLRLLSLASALSASFDERHAALPAMQRVHDLSGETVFLCVRRDFEAVCIERIDGRRVQSLALKLGGALPLHAGAVARTLLAYEPEDFWRRYLERAPLEAFTPSTPTTPETLIPELRKIRKRGVAISDQDVTIGIAAIGAPVFDLSGKACAAVSISGLRSSILGADSHARDLITEAASTISRNLGFGSAKRGVTNP